MIGESQYSFTAPSTAATSFTTTMDFPYSGDHHGSVDGRRDHFSYSELLAGPMDDSTPSPDPEAIAGSLGGDGGVSCPWDNSWTKIATTSCSGQGFDRNGPTSFMDPVSVSGFLNSPPADFPSFPLMQSPTSMPYQQYPSSAEPRHNQLFTMTPPSQANNLLFAVSGTHKEKRATTSNQGLVRMDKPEDGYNWRKYGQKPIKDRKYSRSYYKCTHLHCPVKKKVQNSMAGRATHIIYKGHHNHGPPHSAGKRASEDSIDAYPRFEEDEADEACAEGSRSGAATSEGAESSGPKIVVQTRSEVELLNDGYRWRKYGQKVVKGNHNPRSYYKCTSNGCVVRKQVERCSRDPEAVITTYDGKHDHDVPPGRNNSSSSAQQQATLHNSTAAFLRLKEEQVDPCINSCL